MRKINHINVGKTTDSKFNYGSLYIHRADKVESYDLSTQRRMHRAMFLLTLFVAKHPMRE